MSKESFVEPDYKVLFEQASGLYMILDQDLRVVAASDAYLKETLTNRCDIIGRHVFEVFPDNPDDPSADAVQNSLASFKRVLQTGETDHMVVQRHDVRKPESEGGGFEVRYWSPVNSPILNPDGSVAYIMHRVENVTDYVLLKQQGIEQTRLTDELREQAVRMEADLYSRSREVAETSLKLKQANEELSMYREQLEDLVRKRTAWLEASNVQLRMEIEDRKRAEEALRQSEARYRVLHESLRDAFVKVSMDGRIIEFNDHYCQMLGYSPEEMYSLRYQDLTPEHWRAFEEGIVREQIIPRGYSDVYEKEYRRKDGTIIPVEMRTILSRDGSGRPSAMWAIIRDIAERKLAEEALRESERLQRLVAQFSELAANLSTVDELVEAVGERVAKELGVSRCGFSRVDLVAGEVTVLKDYHSDLSSLAGVYPISKYMEHWQEDGLAGRTAVIEDVATHPLTASLYETAFAPIRVRAHLTVPLHHEGRWVANFWASHHETRRWTGREIELMKLVAERVWGFTQRKEAEEALCRSEERFRLMADAIPHMVWTALPDGRNNFYNSRTREFIGWPIERLCDHGWADAVHPDDRPRVTRAWSRAVATGEEYRAEFRILRFDGAYVWHEARALPIFRDGSSIAEWFGTCTDIHVRKEVEEELRRSRDELEIRVRKRTAELEEAHRALKEQSRKLDAFFEHSLSSVVFLDTQFNFIRVNQAYAKACGLDPQEFIGRNHFELYPHEENQAIFERVVQSKQAYQAQARPFVFPDHPEWGTTYWDWTLVPILDGAGEVEFLVFSLNDVTERERAVQALKESEQLYAKAQQVGHFGHWSRDLETDRVVWSAETYRIFGVSTESFEPTLENFLALVHPLDRDPLLKAVQDSIVSGNPLETEYHIIRPDGSERTIYSASEARKDERSRTFGLIGTLHDITDRKRAEEALKTNADRLEQLNEELKEFAFVASHDLAEPLRKIQAFGSRLRARCAASLGEEERDYLERMENAANRMQILLQSLLAYSRVTTRAKSFTNTDLGQIAQEVVDNLELVIERVGGRVEIGVLPVVEADQIQMGQLLQNLIGNGLKYCRKEENPVIRVHAEAENGKAHIFVQDNGIGFDEKYLDRIFKPFQRLHSRSSEYEGTGMGLAICRKIVERHGGTITAKSIPGEGSTFIVTVPIIHSGEREHPTAVLAK